MGPNQVICAVRCASQKPLLRCDAVSLRFALSLRKSTATQAAMGASLRGRCRDVVNVADAFHCTEAFCLKYLRTSFMWKNLFPQANVWSRFFCTCPLWCCTLSFFSHVCRAFRTPTNFNEATSAQATPKERITDFLQSDKTFGGRHQGNTCNVVRKEISSNMLEV